VASKRPPPPFAAAGFGEQLKAKARRRRTKTEALAAADLVIHPRRNDLTPRLTVEQRAIAALKTPARNVRKKDAAHVRRIANSIAVHGFCLPVLVDREGQVIDGVVRLEAARLMDLRTVSVIVCDHLTPAEVRNLRLTLNRTQELGGWDLGELRIEIGELAEIEELVIETGFTAPELDAILLDDDGNQSGVEPGPLEPDDSPAVARAGDIFILGDHKLACGDARDLAVLQALFEGEPAARFVFTDVPFNVKIAGNVTKGHHREFAMASGELSDEEFGALLSTAFAAASAHLMDGGLLASFIDWRGLHQVQAAAVGLGLAQLNLVVWTKTNAGMGSLYRSQHELLPIFKKGKAQHINNVLLGKAAGRWRSNAWRYAGASSLGSDARKGLKDHPTVKPVAMLEDALLDLTNPGEIVLDAFAGSGSTLIAAERTRRRCFAIELDPIYVDLIVRRWEEVTGEEAVHAASGMTMDELRAERFGPEKELAAATK
jgi:DNA modification methylase